MPAIADAPPSKRRFKMRLVNDEYMADHGGWNPAGSVLVVDEDTAVRWLENRIATQAGKDEMTAAEIRRAELLARLEPVDEDDAPAPRRAPIGRQAAPPPPKQPVATPRRRQVQAVRPELLGSGVINSLDDVPEDDEDGE